jgi:acyl transferase domain-containing protein/SAM-dependent methyltransferase
VSEFDVAVIGMACRFPGAGSVEQYWSNLKQGVVSITRFTDEQLSEAGVDAASRRADGFVPAGAVIERAEEFDAELFGYAAGDAERMDPQHRVFLELAWEALERAAYTPEGFDGAIGVFAGAGLSTHLLNLYERGRPLADVEDFQLMVGNGRDFLATRVAYKLDLRGPCVSVQTACSTSLVAVQLACQSLLNHQCDMALAGGVSIRLPRRTGYLFREEMILSPDGHCRAFDRAARGTVFGEGAGIVVLRRLEDALVSGDHVHAVLRGAAINNDGARKIGFAAPSELGQAEVIRLSHALAEVDPASIACLEAHGTGTVLGDGIEVAALRRAFKEAKGGPHCALGSVKSNVGHLDAAAGVAGLIKAVKAVEEGVIPPSVYADDPRDDLREPGTPFYLNPSLRCWPQGGGPRRAAVSSFGFGGTNAHVVVEQAPEVAARAARADEGWQALALSARSPESLDASEARLREYLASEGRAPLCDVAHSLRVGRRPLEHRRVLLAREGEAIAERVGGVARGDGKPVAFLFPGQGTQYFGMTRGLYRRHAAYRSALDACAEGLRGDLDLDLRELLFGAERNAENLLARTRYAQPALFSVEYALAQLWTAGGVQAGAVAGHSVGEFAAACTAGILSLGDALRAVALRGRLCESLAPGGMLAVALGELAVRSMLSEDLEIAAVNAPDAVVVSGSLEALSRFESDLSRREIASHRLESQRAFHSRWVEPALEPFARFMAGLELAPARIPFVPSARLRGVSAASDPRYWSAQLREPVRFGDAVTEIERRLAPIFLEVGPGEVLARLVQRHSGLASPVVVSSLADPRRQRDEELSILAAGSRLWASGVAIRQEAMVEPGRGRRVPLPGYPFAGRRYRMEVRPARHAAPREDAAPRRAEAAAGLFTPSWRRRDLPRGVHSEARRWLLLAPPSGFVSELASEFRKSGDVVVLAEPAGAFAVLTEEHFALRPAAAEDWHLLLETLGSADGEPTDVLHLHGLLEPGEAGVGSPREWLHQLLACGQALARRRGLGALRIQVFARSLFEVVAEDMVDPERGLLTGVCRVLPQEIGALSCRCVDPGSWSGGSEQEAAAVRRIAAEARVEESDHQVALRAGHRWIRTYEPVEIPTPISRPARLREEGVYLITGGSGGVAGHLCEFLAREARARLVLVSRTPIARAAEQRAREPLSLDAEAARLDALLERLREQASGRIAKRREIEPQLEQLALLRLGEQLGAGAGSESGWFAQALPNVRAAHRRFAERLDAARRGSASLAPDRAAARDRARAIETDLIARHPDLQPLLTLLGECVGGYRDLFSGGRSGLELLFPEGATASLRERLGGILDLLDSSIHPELVLDLMRDLARRLDRPLRVLEIGAGIGLLSDALLGDLDDVSVEYWFTDVGRSFVADARQRSRPRRGVAPRFAELDISRDPLRQGFEPASFDMIVGLDVVHATPDVAESLANLRSLLVPGGVLALIEIARSRLWVEMIWGVLEGWWHVSDFRTGADSPLLDAEQWHDVTGCSGFREIHVFPGPGPAREASTHSLILAQAAGDPAARAGPAAAERRLDRLRELGAEVLVARADVCDETRMREVVAEAERRFGPIDGIFHAAGVAGGGLLPSRTATAVESELRAKVDGTRVLDRIFAGKDLDFMLLWSSIASICGGVGQSTYAAASAFLDSYAHSRKDDAGRLTCAIDWPLWAGVGTAIEVQRRHRELTARGDREDAITVATALDAVRRVLSGARLSQLIVSPIDVHELIERFDQLDADAPAPGLREAAARHPRPRLMVDYAEPRGELEERLARAWADALGIDRVGRDDSFFDLGGDSLMGLKLVSRIRKEERVDVRIAVLFERPTISRLADLIREARSEKAATSVPAPDEEIVRLRKLGRDRLRARGAARAAETRSDG